MDERSTPRLHPNDDPRPASGLERHLRPELFKALGDATRLQVLGRLITAPEPQTVSDVADCCGVHLSGVSRHLAALRDAGLVLAERHGREVRYSLDCEAITGALRAAADAIDACRAVCCPPGTDGATTCPPISRPPTES